MFLSSPTKLCCFELCRDVAAPIYMWVPFSVRRWRRKAGIQLVAPGQVRKSKRARGTRTSVYYRAERLLAWGKQHKTVAKCHQTVRNSCFYLGQRLPISKLAAVKEKIKTRAVSHRLLREGTVWRSVMNSSLLPTSSKLLLCCSLMKAMNADISISRYLFSQYEQTNVSSNTSLHCFVCTHHRDHQSKQHWNDLIS